jgi:hypothetical protein
MQDIDSLYTGEAEGYIAVQIFHDVVKVPPAQTTPSHATAS